MNRHFPSVHRLILVPSVLALLVLTACTGLPQSPTPTGTGVVATPTQTPTGTGVIATPTQTPTGTGVIATPTQTPTGTGVVATPTQTPTATGVATTPTQTPTGTGVVATPLQTPTGTGLVATTRSQANLRGGPGTDYPVIDEIGAGQEVTVTVRSADGQWIRLDMDGPEETWIAASLLRLPPGVDLPVATALPTPPPAPKDQVAVGETNVTLPTYPWQAFIHPVMDEAAHWQYGQFDRAAYEASNPQPSPKSYHLVTLENRWLRLSVMPELGGRLYQLVFKPTGNNELYQNPVIKPSPWGPGAQGNGWLAAGGIEWGFPVPEHGYTWAEPWGFITEPRSPAAAITVFTQDLNRPQLNVHIGMEPDRAAVTLDFDVDNLADVPVQAAYWTNAMLAPGAANKVGPNLRFLFPGQQMAVHSSGESNLPGAGQVFSWPVHNGRDVSRLGTWGQWLGFFATPKAAGTWSAVYDTDADEGVVRVFDPAKVPGLKGFGLGWGQPIAASNYTDGDSSYVEMQGGLTPTFADTFTLSPGQGPGWRETWYPVAGIGGVSAADADGAAHLTREGLTSTERDGLRLRLFSVSSREGLISVSGPEGELLSASVTLDPAHPADLRLPASSGPLSFQFKPTTGAVWSMSGLVAEEG